ncbi:DUF3278 domain-containing protein [Lentilactobacillus sp. SPB1-3]|uniref:DUF3278 domain-containing protein n=1 Tax=Lentilactobacillus terminaliae TaxID=3003483 RepID=A0ACD5DEI6_9LACO|nr:DUF3278 domain-containing protein [Lentilactobacillus sp. SPB1-3]MCZ0977724.1 DUF3278 domain-containing protein [Lentilactobacillus sp. SPB1-3]
MNAINKWFWGLEANLDEVQKQELAAMNNKLFALAITLNILIMTISLIWDIYQRQLSMHTILIAIMLLIISGYAMFLSRTTIGRYVITKEITSEKKYRSIIKHLRIRTILQTIYYFVVYTLLSVFGSSYILNEKPTTWDFGIALITSIFVGLFMYIWNKSKIKRNF